MDIQTSESAVPLLRFEYSGHSRYDTIVLVSPFYPFNHFIIKQLIDRLELTNSKIIYTEFPPGYKRGATSLTITDMLEFYRQEIARHTEKVILIGFGIFAVVFSVLYNEESAAKLILFEPDFSNMVLERFFDSSMKIILFKSSLLLKYFTQGKVEKQYLHKLRIRQLKSYFYSVRTYLQQNKIFQPFEKGGENIHIFWNIMEKETFPLAQVLSEEYSVDLYKIQKTIYEELSLSVKGTVIKSLEQII